MATVFWIQLGSIEQAPDSNMMKLNNEIKINKINLKMRHYTILNITKSLSFKTVIQ